MHERPCLLSIPGLLSLVGLLVLPAAVEGGTLVVANKAEATVSLVDLPSGEVRATLPTGKGPHEVAVSPNGRWALISNYGLRGEPGSSLTLIDVPAALAEKTIKLTGYERPHGLAWLPDGRHALVTAEEDKLLLTVDVETGAVTQKVDTGQEISHMVVATPDGARAFVTNIGSGSVTAIDLEAGKRLRNVPTGEGAEGVALSPDGSKLWITNRDAENVMALDTASLKILRTLDSPSFPIRAECTPDGRHVLVSNARSGDLSIVDTGSGKVARRVKLELDAKDTEGRLFGSRFGDSSVPIGIEIDPDGKRAYVAHANADAISIVDLESWKRVGTLYAGKEPDGMGYSPLMVGVRAVK